LGALVEGGGFRVVGDEAGFFAMVKSGGFRVVGDEAGFFAMVKSFEFGAVDDGHESDRPKKRENRNDQSYPIRNRRAIPRLRKPTFRRSE